MARYIWRSGSGSGSVLRFCSSELVWCVSCINACWRLVDHLYESCLGWGFGCLFGCLFCCLFCCLLAVCEPLSWLVFALVVITGNGFAGEFCLGWCLLVGTVGDSLVVMGLLVMGLLVMVMVLLVMDEFDLYLICAWFVLALVKSCL